MPAPALRNILAPLVVLAVALGFASRHGGAARSSLPGPMKVILPGESAPGAPGSIPSMASVPAAEAETDAEAEEGVPGPERERQFFDDWHGVEYGAVLPPEVLQRMRSDVDALPAPAELLSTDGWSLMGPSGMKQPGTSNLYSGRILDFAWRFTSGQLDIWIAAASGGLWYFNGNGGAHAPLTDDLPTQCVSTVSVDPTSGLNLVIGTGEAGVRGGLGVFRSTDGGATWQATSLTGAISGEVHRIRHLTSTTLLCAATNGIFRSTDGGANWTQIRATLAYDLAVNPAHTDTVYTTFIEPGFGIIARSVDGGATFPPSSFVGVPACGRGAIALCRSKPWIVYAAFAKADTLGWGLQSVAMTPNGGVGWYGVNLPANYLGIQGWYDNVVAVDPTNQNHIYLGGVDLVETTNAGTTWTTLTSTLANGLHADYHAFEWVVAGPDIFPLIGHDGGWSYKPGATFLCDYNNFPITQYTHVRAAPNDRLVMGGGSQDNGMSITTDGGTNWYFRAGGDGSDLSIDPTNTQRMWNMVGVFNGALTFRRQRTEDAGVTWADKNAGITAQGNWYTDVDNDRVNPVYLYTNADNKVYRSVDYGDNWTLIGTFSTTVRAVDVGKFTSPDAAAWAVLDHATTGDRVYCWNGTSFDAVDAGLPADVPIRSINPHPREPNTAFALVNGFASPGHKVFRTFDRGQHWEDVTGNLPNVPLAGVVAHPTNPDELFLGSEAGCFRGFKSAGQWHWYAWSQGLPKAVIVSDMTWADEMATTGKFYVMAGTYGRSLYRREIGDLDVSAVPPGAPAVTPAMALAQNMPNPVRINGATRIAFTLPKPAPVQLRLFDVSGRAVSTLLDASLPAGVHEYSFTPGDIAPGVYFYRLEAGDQALSRKMIVRR